MELGQMPVKYPRQKVRLPYPRSRSGCLVCRRLHKKCDERRPECTRCGLKGKSCQWPASSGQREPDPGDAPPAQVIIPHPNSNNPRVEDVSSPVPIFRPGGGRSGSRDEVPRLTTLSSCSMGSVSSMFLAHFVAETSRFMTTVRPEKNPFLTHLLPLAFSDELILHSLLALGGAHLEHRQSSPEINAWVCRHYGHVICLLQDTISRKSNEPLDWLRVLLAQIILYLIGVFGSAQDEGAMMMHIRAGRKVARRLLSASSKTSDLRVLCGFTFELYTYLALIASPTPYNNGTESELDTRSSLLLSWDILKNYGTFGLIVSPIYQSLNFVPRVISLCTRRQAEIMFEECLSEKWAEFVELMTLIETVGSSGSGSADDLPDPANSPEEHEQSMTVAAIYRHSLAIFAYDAMWCGAIAEDESRLAAVREHALSALMLIPTLMDTPLRNILLWPTIVIGSCLVNEMEWDVIRNVLSIREPVFVVMKMKSMLENLWAENDPAYFGPYGLYKHMMSHQIVIYLA